MVENDCGAAAAAVTNLDTSCSKAASLTSSSWDFFLIFWARLYSSAQNQAFLLYIAFLPTLCSFKQLNCDNQSSLFPGP